MNPHADARDVLDTRAPSAGMASSPPQCHVLTGAGQEHAPRWRDGERLDHLFENQCDRLRRLGRSDSPAVDTGDAVLTYDELDARANRLARYLIRHGVRPGERVGLLFDQAVPSYAGMLAVLKAHAAYVPLDAGFPADRLAYIAGDAGVRTVLTLSHLADRLAGLAVTPVCLDAEAVRTGLAGEDGGRLTETERDKPDGELCYVIYTSGSTGRPKGVAVEHASVCNFVRVAAEVYGLEPRDRVYQGMTIAFDFSIEEIWVPWAVGATLVPKPGGSNLLGQELWDFLQERRVTALCCVPTLLATLEEDLPLLRWLLVSGEACPQDLIARWHRPDRRFLNVYGPTEATVTATWAQVHPGRPVTIGVPLPTYSVVILAPDEARALPYGEPGEIGIAGTGLAAGYLGRADLTERAFVEDFVGIPGNPSGRIYRTGDLGRINHEGEIEYHGRIDTQVKISGYRIELTEIESVLLRAPGIAQAVVSTWRPEPGVTELVAYYSPREGAPALGREELYARLRAALPGYMVPAYLEELAAVPVLPSGKADHKSLPAPRGRRSLTAQHAHAAPTTDTEKILADLLAQVLRLAQVSVASHFFNDLGANSLLMARFCTRVRKWADLPSVSMKDVYLHPTVRSLAEFLAGMSPATAGPRTGPQAPAAARAPEPAQVTREAGTPTGTLARTPARTARYVLCGALQLLLFLGVAGLTALVMAEGFRWVSAGTGFAACYARALPLGCAGFLAWCALPVLAKWTLVGRWRPREIPVWSLAYVRFWVVKTLIRSGPLVMFAGSPLYVLYLRALGAKIGRGVVIFSRNVPVCTDLLTVGEGTVIRKDAFFLCYSAEAGVIRTGTVTLGRNAFVGEATVIDIGTSLGDAAQLGHSSCLPASRSVPDGEHWHGSPAQRTSVDYQRVAPARCGTARRCVYGTLQLLNVLLLSVPLGLGAAVMLLAEVPMVAGILDPGNAAVATWTFYREALELSVVLFFGGVLTGLVFVVTVPRALNLGLRPGRVYPLYGVHYWLQRTIESLTNRRFFTFLFGDSSYIVHYLRALGYDLSHVEQTGSNFGMAVKHATPYLSTVGSGTMVSDGLSLINADFSSTSFHLSRASIGAHSFLGNNITYPAGGRTGDDCLLATKVMVPLDGEIREGTGLLGSPSFEIPRSVQRDTGITAPGAGTDPSRSLGAKNRHNLVTIALYLLVRWAHFLVLTLAGLAAVDLYGTLGAPAVGLFLVLTTAFSVGYFVLVDRAVTGFRALKPKFCSIYDLRFWQHERFWKVPAMTYVHMFDGTPFKNAIWRLLGVRIGSRVFDDGCWMTERSLVTVGDDCTLNAGSTLQSHSLEDGTFKSGHITLGDGCTVGVNAFVHYGVTIGDGAVLGADSFLMKGEEIAPHTRWRGNPAQETVRAPAPV